MVSEGARHRRGEIVPKVSVIFVSYNTRELTLQAIAAVYDTVAEGFPVEIVVVDNASVDGSAEAVRERFPEAIVIASPVNLGFGRGNNLGARHASGETLFFLNTDTVTFPGAIERLYGVIESDPQVGVVGARLEYADGRYQHSMLKLPTVWRIFCTFFWLDRLPVRAFSGSFDIGADPDEMHAIESAHGAAMMIPAEVFDAVGGFDEEFFMYYEECDLCKRIADRGFACLYQPEARVVHFIGASSRSKPWWFFRALRESRMIYARKHMSALGRVLVAAIVHCGYGLRIALFGALGLFSGRLRSHGKNMYLSYVHKGPGIGDQPST